ncbi:MAG: aminotransferase class I/II-fold pyridoxal phosphate-dependent enzyme [Bacteroidetes bacterium]|nr:aminotransferase class I/II-fold pyridoxal phosphate-dependent enzyme [Bacteroidota bacterium]
MDLETGVKSKHEQILSLLDEVSISGKKLGIILQTIENSKIDGRHVTLNGKRIKNFSSCSYLGLDLDQRLMAGAIDAITRFGVQFSSSRSYLSSPLYGELEEKLSRIFKAPAAVFNTTTLGHLSNLPILIGDEDAIVMDVSVHSSVQMAVSLLKERNIHTEIIRHSRLDILEDRVKELSLTHKKVWYLSDGVYSMFGDLAPINEIVKLMDIYEQLYLYVDDAHGMSWAGENGAGYVMSQVPFHKRMYLTTSLGKAFGASGGVMVFPDDEDYRRVHDYGKTSIFSIQVPPPVLGAAVASAKIHLSADIYTMQKQLQDRIKFFNQTAKMLEIPMLSDDISPVKFVCLGKPIMGYNMVSRLMNAGFYVNLSVFPSVSYNNTGMRIPLSLHMTKDDISELLNEIALQLPQAMKENGTSIKEIKRYFKLGTK